jgi:hypothetical protein
MRPAGRRLGIHRRLAEHLVEGLLVSDDDEGLGLVRLELVADEVAVIGVNEEGSSGGLRGGLVAGGTSGSHRLGGGLGGGRPGSHNQGQSQQPRQHDQREGSHGRLLGQHIIANPQAGAMD